MNVNTITTLVKRQFGDESGVQITDSDITTWINAAMRQIVLQNEGLLEVLSVSNLVGNQQEYDLPVDNLIFRGMHLRTNTGNWLRLQGLTWVDFNEKLDGAIEDTSRSGDPAFYTLYGSKIIIYPIPAVTRTNALKIFYSRAPIDVTTGLDIPELPVLYHDAIVKYCLQQAYEMDENPELAGIKATELNADLMQLRGRLSWPNQERYQTITVLDEDM
jgi:hypothetical protein